MNLNQVIIEGNLTRDVEGRTAGESFIASFGLAHNERWKDRSGDWKERVHYFDVTAWKGLGERVARDNKKGDPVIVAGRLQLEQWEDKKTGEKRSKVAIVASEVRTLSRPARDGGTSNTPVGSASGGQRRGRQATFEQEEPIDESAIPF